MTFAPRLCVEKCGHGFSFFYSRQTDQTCSFQVAGRKVSERLSTSRGNGNLLWVKQMQGRVRVDWSLVWRVVGPTTKKAPRGLGICDKQVLVVNKAICAA